MTESPERSTSRPRLAVVLYSALLCWAIAILWLSSLTPRELPEGAFLLWDKLNHVLAFAVGGCLAATALRVSRPTVPVAGAVAAAIVLIAAFGVVDETVQTLTPGRTGGDLRDWIADVIGAVFGALLSLFTHRRICRDGGRLV